MDHRSLNEPQRVVLKFPAAWGGHAYLNQAVA